jgi:preprotein translocase subunit SecD
MIELMKRLAVVWSIVVAMAMTSNVTAAEARCPEVGFTVVEPHGTSETRPLRVGGDQTLFVRRESITRTSDIVEIKLRDDGGDDVSLLLKFTPLGTQRLHDATTNHFGRRIAFLFNDEVLNNVVWEGPYGLDAQGAQVSMRHGMHEARKLMKAIRGCTAATVSDRTP